jgi:hypothetical protein
MLLFLFNGISQISRVRFLGFGTARDGNSGMGESSTSPILLRAVLIANCERHFALPGPGNDRTLYRFVQFVCALPLRAIGIRGAVTSFLLDEKRNESIHPCEQIGSNFRLRLRKFSESHRPSGETRLRTLGGQPDTPGTANRALKIGGRKN